MRGRVVSVTGVLLAGAASLLLAACGSSGSKSASTSGGGGGQKTVTLGVPTVLSGPLSEIGQGASQGIQMAVDTINAQGGVLGAKIKLVVRDDKAAPPDAINVTRSMIQSDHVAAILGSSTSSTAAAEAQLGSQSRVPVILWGGNDQSLTAKKNPFLFQLEPTTYMEPRGAAQYLAKLPFKKYYFVAYDYSFGHDSVNSFKAAMKDLGHPVTDVGESYTQLFASDYRSVIGAAIAKHPDVVFMGLFGGDQLNFVKQASSFGLLKVTKAFGPSGTDTLFALKGQTPAGVMLADRDYFPSLPSRDAAQMAQQYHAKFGEWPNEWAVTGYSAVQTWADGVRKAGTFDGAKVSSALSGSTVDSIRGPFRIRACDNQAEVPEYFGTVGAKVDPTYGFPPLEKVFVSNPATTLPPCP